VSLLLLSKNLLFRTLGSQIINDFVWKSQTGGTGAQKLGVTPLTKIPVNLIISIALGLKNC